MSEMLRPRKQWLLQSISISTATCEQVSDVRKPIFNLLSTHRKHPHALRTDYPLDSNLSTYIECGWGPKDHGLASGTRCHVVKNRVVYNDK